MDFSIGTAIGQIIGLVVLICLVLILVAVPILMRSAVRAMSTMSLCAQVETYKVFNEMGVIDEAKAKEKIASICKSLE